MASPTQWAWVWVNSGSWWWTGRPGVMRFVGSQRVGHDWATELNWCLIILCALETMVLKTLLMNATTLIHVTNLDNIKKQRHHFADKSTYCQRHFFFSSHVQMWELDHKEGWTPKNWCFQRVVLEKTSESPLDSKEIKPVNPKRNQPWIFTGRTDAEIKAPILWEPDVKSRLTGKDPDAGKDWGQA